MKKILIASLVTLAAGCTAPHVDLCGTWSRQAEEPAMSLSGVETIDIRPDSTFTVTNSMRFSHSDSAFTCVLNLIVRVPGEWSTTNQGDFLMKYDASNLEIEPDSATFRLNAAKADVEIPADIAAATYRELIDGVCDYYTTGYASITSNGGLLLTSPQIIDSQLYARIGPETLTWTPTN